MLRQRFLSLGPTQCLRLQPLSTHFPCVQLQSSALHTSALPKPDRPRVPRPTVDIPDVKTFLERIGRDAFKECEDKIRTWKELFVSDGQAFKKKEIPARLRRYILWQVERYRNGEEIVYIRRGKKVGGGERRRNQAPTKTKLKR